MQQNKYRLLCFMPALILASCIKSYEPQITTLDAYKLVVSGIVTDRKGAQTVTVSMASSINKPKVIPVSGCTVVIRDNENHTFLMADSSNGIYRGFIDPVFLTSGHSFKVEILTPDGNRIVSDFDSAGTCPPVDSVYYIRKDLPTSDPTKFVNGIQFYLDLNGNSTDSKYYRLEATETWEYHAEYPKEWYYSKRIDHVYPPDYSMNICWQTLLIRNIYTLSTDNLTENKYRLFPLNFVDNRTQRLVYGYSLLVNQYALSKAAFRYWNQLRINSSSQGGLYEKQPLATKGNLHNLTHPDQEVLGFFGVSTIKSKRIFVRNVENLVMENTSTCSLSPFKPEFLGSLDPNYFPIYLKEDTAGNPTILMDKGCVDCRAFFGTLVKPDFWPF